MEKNVENIPIQNPFIFEVVSKESITDLDAGIIDDKNLSTNHND